MRRLVLALLVLLPLLAGLAPAEAQPVRRPDVVVVLLDDAREGDIERAMPRTQALLAGGTWFPEFTFPTPVCCPARASVLTGMYAHNHGVLTNGGGTNGGATGFVAHRNEGRTVAAALRRSGYRTAMVGKYLNGYRPEGPAGKLRWPQGWTRWAAHTGGKWQDPIFQDGGRRVAPKRYLTDMMRAYAVGFVRDAGATPFFLYFAPRAPHSPATPARRHVGAFPEVANAYERKRLQSILSVDDAVVSVAAAMGPARWSRACVMVMSDNGYLLGEHGVVGKGVAYDPGVRVPMLARCPGMTPGTDNRLATINDVAPTVAAVAAVDLPGADGRSLLGSWDREAVLLEWYQANPFFGVRTKHETYVEWGDGSRAWWDRRDDPGEERNLLAPGDPPPAHLADRLSALRSCAGDGCRAAEGG